MKPVSYTHLLYLRGVGRSKKSDNKRETSLSANANSTLHFISADVAVLCRVSKRCDNYKDEADISSTTSNLFNTFSVTWVVLTGSSENEKVDILH